MICPRCGHAALHHSRLRHGGERLLTLLTPMRYYRCHDCNTRMCLWKRSERPEWEGRRKRRFSKRKLVRTLKLAGIVIVLLAIVALIAWPFLDIAKPKRRQRVAAGAQIQRVCGIA